MTATHPLRGGVHPPECKAISRPGELRAAPLPPRLVLPIDPSAGSDIQAVVSVGNTVLGGQVLARACGRLGANVHAPTSGSVVAIEPHDIPHPSGLQAMAIALAVDGEDQWIDLEACSDWRHTDPNALIDQIRNAGVVGLGGAGFPTAQKLIAGSATRIHTVVINGSECEPYITADDTLMQIAADDIIEGAAIIAHIVGAERVVVGIEDNKPEAIAAMSAAISDDCPCSVEVVSFPAKYPSGGERQLIEIITGEQVPSGGYPADIGIVCQNPGTAVAVRDAVIDGRPLTERVVTLTGRALRDPHNVKVRLGTPIDWLLEHAGYASEDCERVIHGGPMMGFSLVSLDAPIIKTSNCLLAPTPDELPLPPPAQACIRCGLCAEACPVSLLPQQLYWYARARDHEQLETHHLADCIECGACAWVCPSHIPLVQYYRSAKSSLRMAAQEKARSDLARERFEARQTRVAKEAAEKAARRAARKSNAKAPARDGAEDPVQAAIARARARKAAKVPDTP